MGLLKQGFYYSRKLNHLDTLDLTPELYQTPVPVLDMINIPIDVRLFPRIH